MTGSGTAEDPYIIQNVTDLQNIDNDLTAYYELGGNIDASATSGWNGGAGFLPIANFSSFTGQLDGKGFWVSDLFIDRSSVAIGLFYENAGTIQNIGLTNIDFTGGQAGAIAYKNSGTITKSYATGALASAGNLAGLVQWNTGTITNSYSRCSVSGSGFSFAAGFVQFNNGGTIDDCYSTGAVTGTFVGGFCQFNDNVITNCFWDKQTSGVATSDGGTGKTTAEMKTRATFADAGWDI